MALVEVMRKYCLYLQKHNDSMKSAHSSPSPIRQVEENILLEVRSAVANCDPQYAALQERLLSLPLYTPVFVNDFSPTDRFVRKHWLDKLHLEFEIKMYCFCHSNSLGSMTFVWRLPTNCP